jgi:hypothetical protein
MDSSKELAIGSIHQKMHQFETQSVAKTFSSILKN